MVAMPRSNRSRCSGSTMPDWTMCRSCTLLGSAWASAPARKSARFWLSPSMHSRSPGRMIACNRAVALPGLTILPRANLPSALRRSSRAVFSFCQSAAATPCGLVSILTSCWLPSGFPRRGRSEERVHRRRPGHMAGVDEGLVVRFDVVAVIDVVAMNPNDSFIPRPEVLPSGLMRSSRAPLPRWKRTTGSLPRSPLFGRVR